VTDDPLTVLGLGFVLGLRHALDVDHLAAVSTLVSQRRGLLHSAGVGAVWGLGHTLALLAVGAVVITLGAHVPPALARGLELAVAAMLVGLGVRVLWTVRSGGTLHVHVHEHGGRRHVHAHVHREPPGAASPHHHRVPPARPLLVGIVHGLAGSAALMLAVLASIASPSLAVAYLAVFGLGSIAGMAAMSALLGMPLALLGGRIARADVALRLAAGTGSIAVGLVLAWRIGVETGVLA
jgi:high-affinity nickel permease